MRRLTLFLCLSLLLLPRIAAAAPFTWIATGNIGATTPPVPVTPFDALLPLGQSFILSVTMESSVPDLEPNPTIGSYQPVTAATFTSGSLFLSTTTGTLLNFEANGGRAIELGLDFTALLHLNLASVITGMSDALPLLPPPGPASLDFLYLTFPFRHSSATIQAVPEPGTLTLLGIGLNAVLRRRFGRSK